MGNRLGRSAGNAGYIIRAAVVTNRLKHFRQGHQPETTVNDESFAKMDERRAHDVIKFIRDSLGMQLICAMRPNMRAQSRVNLPRNGASPELRQTAMAKSILFLKRMNVI